MGTLRFFEEVVSFKIRRTFGFADYTYADIFLFAGVGWKGLLRILRNGNFHKGYGNPLRKDFRWRNACTVGFDGKSIARLCRSVKFVLSCVRE